MLSKITLKYRQKTTNFTQAAVINWLMLVGCLYCVGYGAAALSQDSELPMAQYASAKVNYMLQCQGCHLANGKGSTQAVPDLTEHGAALLQTELGRQFFIQVPGSSNAPLDDQALSDVLNFIIRQVIKANDVALFTASEVALTRGKSIADVGQYRRRLIEKLESGS